MNYSKLSYEQIESLAQNLSSASNNMESVLSEVKNLLSQIGNSEVWSGTSASNIREEFDKLSAKFPEFTQSIEDCSKHLKAVVANYRSVDSTVSNMMHE